MDSFSVDIKRKPVHSTKAQPNICRRRGLSMIVTVDYCVATFFPIVKISLQFYSNWSKVNVLIGDEYLACQLSGRDSAGASFPVGVAQTQTYIMAAWALKMRALTAQVMVDDIEAEEECIADSILNETMATAARPGTSFKNPTVPQSSALSSQRPRTNTGRPLSGVVRPGTMGSRGTLEQALRTPRSTSSARPATAQAGRAIRLGTASMLTQSDGPFIQLSRLNLAKYASVKSLSRPLFQYIFYHENDIRRAMDLVVEALKVSDQKDWWWKLQHGKCYFIFGMMRDAETELRAALKILPTLEVFLWLTRVYVRLDQPVTALDLCRTALQIFKDEVTLLTEIARIFEGINNIPLSVKYYREILHQDAMNVEAIACIAVHYFYSDQPELALRFYRRLLQMGVYNAELFNNLGLCCFFAQQYDMVVSCFEQALNLAIDESAADVWYNISHVAIGVCDLSLAEQCVRLALSIDPSHAAAYNNLAVLEYLNENTSVAFSLLQAASSIAPSLFEPHYNRALLTEMVGDFQTSYMVVQKSIEAHAGHTESHELLKKLKKSFSYI